MSEPELDVALGPDMDFEGLLVLPKPARIDGRVHGTVMAGSSVWVGATGIVEADLEADVIVVEGTVLGDIRARTSIDLGPDAIVSGDMTGPRMTVAEGATVNGLCRCGNPGVDDGVTRVELDRRPATTASAS